MNKFIGGAIVLLFLLQFSFLPAIGIGINLFLALVLILAQRRFDFSGITWIFVCGFLFDLFSSHSFGVNILVFIIISLIINFVNNFFVAFESNRFVNSVVYFVGIFLFELLRYYLMLFFVGIGLSAVSVIELPSLFSFSFLFSAIVFTFVTFALLLVYDNLEKFSGEKSQELIINK